jgi:hypothetical protein
VWDYTYNQVLIQEGMKRPDVGNILKTGRFPDVKKFKSSPKFLGYLTDHRLGAVAISGQHDVSLGEELSAFCD